MQPNETTSPDTSKPEFEPPKIERLSFENGELNMWFKHPALALFASEAASMFDGAGAINYLETQMTTKDGARRFIITIQELAPGKKTPHQLREAAEARLRDIEDMAQHRWKQRHGDLSGYPGGPLAAYDTLLNNPSPDTSKHDRCAQIAQQEYEYWRNLQCSDIPHIEIGAMGAAANIFGAIAMGKTATEHKAEVQGREARAMERACQDMSKIHDPNCPDCLGAWPWCEACQSYHSPCNPTCKLKNCTCGEGNSPGLAHCEGCPRCERKSDAPAA